MGFLRHKKDGKRRKGDGSEKKPSKKWWAKLVKNDEPEPQSTAMIESPPQSTQSETGRNTANRRRRAPNQSTLQRQDATASPALSRASSLSETDAQYLAIQARGRSRQPSPNPGYDADAFAGAFEPVYETRQTLPRQSRREQSSGGLSHHSGGRTRQRKKPVASPTLSRIPLLSGTNLRSRAVSGTLRPSPNFELNTFGASIEPTQNRRRTISYQQIASPPLSQASSLLDEDTQFLAARAESNTPRPRPEFNRDAHAGAFEPERQRHRPQTKYPLPPLTRQQLDALAGVYAPPAPPPRRLDKLDYR